MLSQALANLSHAHRSLPFPSKMGLERFYAEGPRGPKTRDLSMNAPTAFPDQSKPVPPYKHTPLFPLGKDETPYKKITSEGVRVEKVLGKDMLVVSREALRALSEAAFGDINHYLRPGHLKQLRAILEDGARALPDSANLHYAFARLEARQGNLDAALAAARAALAAVPDAQREELHADMCAHPALAALRDRL